MATALSIKGTFDVAVARNSLRKTAEQHGWPPAFRARAAALITALAERALFSHDHHNTKMLLDIQVIEKNARGGLEFSCFTHIPYSSEEDISPARLQLERLSDELKFLNVGGSEHILVRLWIK